uniref:Transcription factor CBF/NF-Y/archaeal histone domain-containing protein n=1 Tax=Globodera rostochiensis TaxID=31243 RepID=A0A914HFY3_GLORO
MTSTERSIDAASKAGTSRQSATSQLKQHQAAPTTTTKRHMDGGSPRRKSSSSAGGGVQAEQREHRKWATTAASGKDQKQQQQQQQLKKDKKRPLKMIHEDNDDDVEDEDEDGEEGEAGPSGDAVGSGGTALSSSNQMRMLPQTKVRSIMEASPNVSGLKISGEAMFAMGKAAEAFISLLAKGAHQQMLECSHVRVNYNELALFVHHNEELNFIQDILPRKHKFSELNKLMLKNKR